MEKVIKSVNALKFFYGGLLSEDKLQKESTLIPKERQLNCNVIAESLILTSVKNNNDFPGLLAVSIETLLQACSDESADVRLGAEECLNKVIKGLYDTSISKILVELYKEIKKNSQARSLRGALTRFSDLCFNIRPAKCRPYILNLLPCLARISQRDEDIVQECLAPSIAKIFGNLGTFASESEVQGLIASFLKNTSHQSVTMRRTASSCLFSIVVNSRKLVLVIGPMIRSVLDILCQRCDDRNTILGCLQTFRTIIPLLLEPPCRADQDFKILLITVFEASLHYLCNVDHTIVTSALELLEQLLKSFMFDISHLLLSSTSFREPTFAVAIDSAHEISAENSSSLSTNGDNHELTSISRDVDNENTSSTDKTTETLITSNTNSAAPQLLSSKDLYTPKTESSRNLDVVPIAIVARLLCQRFLLTEEESHILPDSKVRVSLKNLALNCLSLVVNMQPIVLCLKLHPTFVEDNAAVLSDVLLYRKHSDPKLKGASLMVAASFIDTVLHLSRTSAEDWWKEMTAYYSENKFGSLPNIQSLTGMLTHALEDESSVCVRQACSAITVCFSTLCASTYNNLGLSLLLSLLRLKQNSYWLVKVDLLEILASVNFRQIAYLEQSQTNNDFLIKKNSFQEDALNYALHCLSEDDYRIRKAASEMVVAIVTSYTSCKNLNVDIVSLEAFMRCRDELGLLLGNWDDESSQSSSKQSDLAADKSLLRTHRGLVCTEAVTSYEESLSFLICRVSTLLTRSASKHLTYGCILSLKTLSLKYQPCDYPNAWGCHFIQSGYSNQERLRSESNISNTSNSSNVSFQRNGESSETLQFGGVLSFIMGLLKSTWLPLDIAAHCNTLILVGNLLAGSASHGFQSLGPVNADQTLKSKATSSSAAPWTCIHDLMIQSYASDLYTHLIKLLSVVHHIISDVIPAPPNKIVLPNLTPNANIPSPMKRKEKAKDNNESSKSSPSSMRKILPTSPMPKSGQNKEPQDSDKEKSTKKSLGTFHHSRVYMKLHEMLVGAYKNYKGGLDFGDDDKFCMFVRVVLDVISQLLELASFQDVGPHTEEILGYLKSTFVIEPTLTVLCVQQLLKALFGTNLVSQLESDKDAKLNKSPLTQGPSFVGQDFKSTFSHQVGHVFLSHLKVYEIFHHPLNHLTMAIANSSFHYSHQSDVASESEGWFGSIKKKVEQKLNQTTKTSKGNKSSIQNHIRLFESLVIKSLKLYTVTSSVEFQRHVLNLLAQLVQLRVNYCMLDSDQVFINFIIKQFESIESGMIRGSEELIPHVFFFLVLLSYERYNSKTIIAMPKIIQLCDGLMASGRGAASHVIPALEPIVHDLFVVRGTSKQDLQEMTTQREVVQMMMLKLIQYPQRMYLKVFEMITTILQHSRRDNAERWKQVSRQVSDILLPMMDKLQVEVTGQKDISILHSLFETLSPTSLRPMDLILQIMLSFPLVVPSVEYLHRWLAKVLILMRVLICHYKEQDILQCLSRLSLNVDSFSTPVFSRLFGHKQQPAFETNGHVNDETTLENSSENVLAVFFHQMLGAISSDLVNKISDPKSKCNEKCQMFLCQEIAELLLNLTYMHRSGAFKAFTTASYFLTCIQNQSQFYTSQDMMKVFLKLQRTNPIVSIIWVEYLTHLSYVEVPLWSVLTGKSCDNLSLTTVNRQIVSRGSVILLADFVFCLDGEHMHLSVRPNSQLSKQFRCQHMQQSALMSWLLNNHIHDVVSLLDEPPVQDFISLVLKGPQCSIFVDAVSNYCRNQTFMKSNFIQKVLRCLSMANDNCTGARLMLLVSPHFVFSPIISLVQSCDQLACDDVESLLILDRENVFSQVSMDKLNVLLSNFESAFRQQRFGRLYNLLLRLKSHVTEENIEIETSNNQPHVDGLLVYPDKSWFIEMELSCCKASQWSPECAKVLACLDYDDVMMVMKHEDFALPFLTTCISCGISEVLSTTTEALQYSKILASPIMKASVDVLQTHLHDTLAKVKHNSCFDGKVAAECNENFIILGRDDSFKENVFNLCKCLVKCFQTSSVLPTLYRLPEQAYFSCLRLAVLSCEVILWQLASGEVPRLGHITASLEMLQQILKVNEIFEILNQNCNSAWTICIVQTIHTLLRSYVRELPLSQPYLPESRGSDDLAWKKTTTSCVRLAQMLNLVRTGQNFNYETIPSCLLGPLYNIIIQLSTMTMLNSYVRIPHLLWKYGWEPPPNNDNPTEFPDVPADYLQEKEILSEFISIINHIGWTNRTQFEETWASLLGVLVSQPVDASADTNSVNEESLELSCLAIRGLTSLVINCALQPSGGKPAVSQYKTYHRNQALKLGHTRLGRQLNRVREIVHEELQAIIGSKNHLHTHDSYQNQSLRNCERSLQEWLACNTERILTSSLKYGLGQYSIRSFFELHGITPGKDESEYSSDGDTQTIQSSEYDNSFVNDDSEGSDMFESANLSTTVMPGTPRSPIRVQDGVDVHSCVQFLLDLYTQWFRTAAQASTAQGTPPVVMARPLLCECVRSLLLISDLFIERQQFEWMFSTLVVLHGSQPPDDDIMLQYIVVSMCKAGAVQGMGKTVVENVMPVLTLGLASSLVSCQVFSLYGALYCLECYPSRHIRPVVDILVEYVPTNFVAVSTCPALYNEEYVVVLASTAYCLIERCQDVILPEFTSVIIQASVLMLSSQDTTNTPPRIYHCVTQGLERLVLAFSLSSVECESVLKASADQLQLNPILSRATAACGLMLTCMYCGRMRVSGQNDVLNPNDGPQEQEDAIETRLLAMERISLLFERIKKGYAKDARIMARVLPRVLDDFFPAQDVMNKVIAEFISTLQPFPDLIAQVVHQVFQTLHSRDQSPLVQEWVMLSLSNVIQRTPLSTAVWCLTCLFVSASTNHWINSLLPLVVSRMNRPDEKRDWTCFCKAALDFYTYQLSEELDRRSFHSVFSSSANEGAYNILLDCIRKVDGDQGILQ
ncbi:huntingtin-like isoform X3 [Clavelina lepadiformis]|uniref:huntingtin-like isoform X3 n=1 Tax=Clavelina lepadiformis TaxID=159417 RepID=UPI004040EE8D